MTTIHTGNTTTTGFSVTSDVTGNLVIKTGGAGGTTALTVGADQRVSFAKPPLTAVPAFKAILNATQTGVATATLTKVNVNEVVFDTNWDGTNNSSVGFNETNSRYTAPVSGYYQFDGVIRCNGSSLVTAAAYIYVEGVNVHTGNVIRGSGLMHPVVSTITYLAAGQYAELYGYIEVGSGGSFAYATDVATSIFSGFLVRAT